METRVQERLCQRCRGINIEALLQPDGYNFWPGTRTLKLSAKTCPLCNAIVKGLYRLESDCFRPEEIWTSRRLRLTLEGVGSVRYLKLTMGSGEHGLLLHVYTRPGMHLFEVE